MLHKDNTEELYDTEIPLFKDRYLQFFLFGLGPLAQIHKAAGLHLVCS